MASGIGSPESNLRFWAEYVRKMENLVEKSWQNHEQLVRLLVDAQKSKREAESIVKSNSREN